MTKKSVNCRKDLFERVFRILHQGFEFIRVSEVASFLKENPDEIRKCFVRLENINCLKPSKKSTDEWNIVPTSLMWYPKDLDLQTKFFDFVMEMRKPVQKRSKLCPKCGEPIKRRHGREKVHDPRFCTREVIRKVMES